jgi:pyrimidine operon attenuation protein/uracil phosphoribosyltransferase
MQENITIMDKDQLILTLKRLAHQLIENHYPFTDTCFIGIQPRGIPLSDFIMDYLKELYPGTEFKYGKLDITFYRDDIRTQLHVPMSYILAGRYGQQWMHCWIMEGPRKWNCVF